MASDPTRRAAVEVRGLIKRRGRGAAAALLAGVTARPTRAATIHRRKAGGKLTVKRLSPAEVNALRAEALRQVREGRSVRDVLIDLAPLLGLTKAFVRRKSEAAWWLRRLLFPRPGERNRP